MSADGARVAYVAIADGARKLHVRNLDTGRDSIVLTDARIEHPAWSPAGDRLSWTATGPRGSVYVTPLDGRYTNLLSARHAESAWSPDGKTRRAHRSSARTRSRPSVTTATPIARAIATPICSPRRAGRLWTVDAPSAPDQQLVEQAGSRRRAIARSTTPTRSTNSGIAPRALYYSTPDAAARRAQWEALKAKYRPRALAAKIRRRAQDGAARSAPRASAVSAVGDGPRRGVERASGRDGRGIGDALQGRQRRRRGGRGVVRAWRRRARRERPGRLRPDARLSERDGSAAADRVHVARAGRRGSRQHDPAAERSSSRRRPGGRERARHRCGDVSRVAEVRQQEARVVRPRCSRRFAPRATATS